MKNTLLFILIFSSLSLFAFCQAQTNVPTLATQRDSLSWALGESHARTCLEDNAGLDRDIILQAFIHTMQGAEQPLDEKSYQQAIDYVKYINFVNNKRRESEQGEETARLERAYLQELAKTHPDLQWCEAGFYYEVVRAGAGDRAQLNQRVTFDYKGYNMLSGAMIDQTYGNEAITVTLNDGIFTGLRIGLQLMQAGALYRFYFPNALVFGSKGSRVIPPFTAMIYEVELHQIHLD